MPPIDLNLPLFPGLPGTGAEQIGAIVGSIVLAPLLSLTSQFAVIGSLTGSLASTEGLAGLSYYY